MCNDSVRAILHHNYSTIDGAQEILKISKNFNLQFREGSGDFLFILEVIMDKRYAIYGSYH